MIHPLSLKVFSWFSATLTCSIHHNLDKHYRGFCLRLRSNNYPSRWAMYLLYQYPSLVVGSGGPRDPQISSNFVSLSTKPHFTIRFWAVVFTDARLLKPCWVFTMNLWGTAVSPIAFVDNTNYFASEWLDIVLTLDICMYICIPLHTYRLF